jgi:hypothetical protein
VLGLALPALLCTTACDHSPDSPTSDTPTRTSPTSPAALCTRLVAHWAREVLDSDTYGDYQSMGLSNGQYAILREVVDAARVARRRQGAAATEKLIDRQAHAACVERYRHGTPSGGPWQ